MKTLEVNHAVRRNINNLHNNRNFNPHSKKFKTWNNFVGKSTNCSSFQRNNTLIRYKIEEEGITRYKYSILGCGVSLLCVRCGKLSLYRKLSRTYSLFTSLGVRFPNAKIASIVFTVPHEHPIHKNPSHKNFNNLFNIVHEIISYIFPKCPHLSVLHTWSSSDPNNKHIHIHCLIIGIKDNASLQHLYYPADQINSIWQKKLNYPYSTNIHIEYWLLKYKPKTSHALKYTLRSPILDFNKHNNSKLTYEYIQNMNPLINYQRMRWYGWLSNVKLKKTLASFNIFLSNAKHDNKYNFVCIVRAIYSKSHLGFFTEDHVFVPKSDVVSSIINLKKFFYEVRDPPT